MPTPYACWVGSFYADLLHTNGRASNQKLGALLGVSSFPTLLVLCGEKVPNALRLGPPSLPVQRLRSQLASETA